MGLLDVVRSVLGPIADVLHPGDDVGCPIPWQPHALAPVFWGHHFVDEPGLAQAVAARRVEEPGLAQAVAARTVEVRTDLGGLHAGIFPPTPMHILFPTLDGSPQHAQILHPCGRYPLVVLLHGQCSSAQASHFTAWAGSPLAMQLARAGYVVVVPRLSGNPASDREVALVRSVMRWVRTQWVHARLVADPPATVMIGHSRGSVLAGLVAAQERVAAYVSLSGDWHGSFGDPTQAQKAIAAPMLFVKGAGESDVDLGRFPELPEPKYRAELGGAGHYDYLMPNSSPCAATDRGDCPRTPAVAADLVTLFAGKYAPAQEAAAMSQHIPDTLVTGLGPLTPQQEFYAGAYLTGLDSISIEGCGLRLVFDLPGQSLGAVTY